MQRQAVGPAWDDGGFPNLVFTHPDGSHLSQPTVWKALQKILKKAGLERHRFHDNSKTLGCRKTFLLTYKHNASACRCYEKAGGLCNAASDDIVFAFK